ncbi:MAG: YopX family protein [Bacillota bacterium]
MDLNKVRVWSYQHKKMIKADRLYMPKGMTIENMPFGQSVFGVSWLNKEYDKDFEVMQFSGLYDVNDVPIFEGDVVHGFIPLNLFHDEESCTDEECYKEDAIAGSAVEVIGEVLYEKGGFLIQYAEDETEILVPVLLDEVEDIEVLGNIFEGYEVESS